MIPEDEDMRIIDSCAACLYDKQKHLTEDPEYLARVRELLDHRKEEDTSPYMVYQFALAYEERFGKRPSYVPIKKKYNDLVLSMEKELEADMEQAQDPLARALAYARVGNYIDFGAMNSVDPKTFMGLFQNAAFSDQDKKVYQDLLKALEAAKEFLLITDNCGEIVLDKLFLRQLKKRFPQVHVAVLVRGEEVLNDATLQDAEYAGLARENEVFSNGGPIAGTIYSMLPKEARNAIDRADVILAKGQGNYESVSGQANGFPKKQVFYAFLCKCELFTKRFNVAPLTGVLTRE